MKKQFLLVYLAWLCCLTSVFAQRKLEQLGRGVVAVRTSSTQVFVSWRLLGTDPADLAFNVYRGSVRLNATPLTSATHYVDETAANERYSVRAVRNGVEQAASTPALVWSQNFLRVPLKQPAGGTVSSGTATSSYTYSPNDASVGDLDGDGEYEIVLKWDPSNARDNASAGLSGPVIIDAYRLDGTFLWRIDLGRNIRAGAHYTQFMVADLDGDGRAEVACKTADGTVDGRGTVIGDGSKDYRSLTVPNDATPLGQQVAATSDARYGKILAGPEYFTVFNGMTGAELATTNYLPSRDPLNGWGGIGGNGNSDNTGNRADRFVACVAYLDGQLPSVVMCRGYYGRSVLAAWDWRNGQLSSRWVFDSQDRTNPFSGMGNHNVSVADVDDDGKDEIVYGSMVVDDNGQGLFSTGLRHGDALHVSDLDPTRPGLEVYGVHESEGATIALNSPGTALYNARTGEIYWSTDNGRDVGRGVAADIDPTYPGAEYWGGPGGLRRASGEVIGSGPSSANFAIWWDGDLLRELLDGTVIDKYNWGNTPPNTTRLLQASTFGGASNNGTKATPSLSADLFGDWREEVIWRNTNNRELLIFTTTTPTSADVPRIYTLMHDPQYRNAIAWQNAGYNQPPHPGFFLGAGMATPPRPNIALITRPFQLEDPTYDCATGQFTFRSSGGDGSPVEFFAVGITSWTTQNNGYVLEPWLRTATFELKARQNGVEVSRLFTAGSCPSGNTAPYALNALPNQTTQQGQPFTYEVPITSFADAENNILTYSLVGQPAGIAFNPATRLISGTPTDVGSFTLVITATDPDGLSGTNRFVLTVQPATTGGPLALLAPEYDCATGSLSFRSSGGDGSPVEFFAVGITSWTPTVTHVIDPWLRTATFELKARQNGVEVSRSFTATTCPNARRGIGAEPEVTLRATLSPNPADEEVLVTIDGASNQTVYLQLTDLSGRAVVDKQIRATASRHQERLKLGSRPAGGYLLRVSAGGQVVTLKVLKQ